MKYDASLWGGLLAALVVCAPAPAAPAKSKLVDRVGLIVGREAFTAGEIEEAVVAHFLAQGQRPPASPTAEYRRVRREVVDRLTEETLLAREAEKMGFAPSEREVASEVDKEIEKMRGRFSSPEEFRKALTQEGVTEGDLRAEAERRVKFQLGALRALRAKREELRRFAEVPEEEVRRVFEKDPRQWDEVKFSVIFFRIPEDAPSGYGDAVEEQAGEVLRELEQGADFEAYARKYSEDPETARRGGMAGTFLRREMDRELAEGVFKVPTGKMGLVRSKEGVSLVKVHSKTRADFDSAASRIREKLREERLSGALKEWLEGLKKDVYVKVLE